MKIAKVLNSTFAAAVIAGAMSLGAAPAAQAGVFVSVGIAPPPIPVYDQPLAPGYGYIWTPGYWAWGPDGYYWVDGAWVYPPYEDALWTPGYWDFAVGGYFWHPGYWGRTVGYYGGINYGFGYFGTGFWGGYWNGGHFFYNTAYNHIGFRNSFVYNRPVEGFNGRPGGLAYARGQGNGPVGAQTSRGSEALRGAQSFQGNQGFNRANGFAENRGSNLSVARADYNGGARTFAGAATQFRANPGAQARGFAGTASNAGQARSFSSGSFAGGQARSFSGGGFSGGGGRSSFSGGGSRGGGRR
jgi:hypothetical protein